MWKQILYMKIKTQMYKLTFYKTRANQSAVNISHSYSYAFPESSAGGGIQPPRSFSSASATARHSRSWCGPATTCNTQMCLILWIHMRYEVTAGWRTLRYEQLHNLYSSPNIISMVKWRNIRWVGHVAHIGRYKKLLESFKERHYLMGVISKSVLWWDSDDWIDLTQDCTTWS